MRALLAAATAAAILGTACIVVPVRPQHSAVSADRCPPGHPWSDGRCHAKGKGHDPKHER